MLRRDHHEFNLGHLKSEKPIIYIDLYIQVGGSVEVWLPASKTMSSSRMVVVFWESPGLEWNESQRSKGNLSVGLVE